MWKWYYLLVSYVDEVIWANSVFPLLSKLSFIFFIVSFDNIDESFSMIDLNIFLEKQSDATNANSSKKYIDNHLKNRYYEY